MLIRIVDDKRDSTFECVRHSIWAMGGKDKGKIMVEIRGKEDHDIPVPTDGSTKVYIMNDSGHTIQELGWPETSPPVKKKSSKKDKK